ncbi:hypothetical protein TVAG_459840 [Trichomonas vaginalis G3]|uniref:Uncharacterized protein n=1 Tax=Trichomonas vaginalis (strain ATCC PRA-98 / G3) TaxID=412133 RepID=A2G4K8_TRIV3|nr:armadillo (ARM) repeat-containing protein family [Trichomonas vaginalis G3]EAX87908.1 hypothetical protein TVAG_459840 [Trichomonas vaginalis G3]KAI5538386.1 armadillo (ARM) repeat-containing protein family [Trichomonas vaginalis G3]|eukprot:XP_001300838.1 hypothetical protein [Trichomonas vaginalis G3]
MNEELKKLQHASFDEICSIITNSDSNLERGYAALQLDSLISLNIEEVFTKRNLLIVALSNNLENYSVCNIIITSFTADLLYEWTELHEFIQQLLQDHDQVNIRIASLILANILPYFAPEDFESYHHTIMLTLYNCANAHLIFELADILARITYCSEFINDFVGPINECFISLEKSIVLGDDHLNNMLSVPLCAIIESEKVPEVLQTAITLCLSPPTNLSLFWLLNSIINTYPDEIQKDFNKIFNKTFSAMKTCPTEDVIYIAETMELLSIKFPQQFGNQFLQSYDIKTERSIYAFVTTISSTVEHAPFIINQKVCHSLIISLQCTQMYVKLATIDAMKEVAMINDSVRVTILEQLYDLMGAVDQQLLSRVLNAASFIIDSFPLPPNMIQTLIDRIRVLIRPISLCRHLCVSLVFSVGYSISKYNSLIFPIISQAALATSSDVDPSLKCRSIEAIGILSYGLKDQRAEDIVASCMADETDEVVLSVLIAVSYFAKFHKNIQRFKEFTEKYVQKYTEQFTQEFFINHSYENFFLHQPLNESVNDDQQQEDNAEQTNIPLENEDEENNFNNSVEISEIFQSDLQEKFERSQHGWFLTVSILAKRLFKNKCNFSAEIFLPVCIRILDECSLEEKCEASKAISCIFTSDETKFDQSVVEKIIDIEDRSCNLRSMAILISKFPQIEKESIIKLSDYCLEILSTSKKDDEESKRLNKRIYFFFISMMKNFKNIFPISHLATVTSFPNCSQTVIIKIIIRYLKDVEMNNKIIDSLISQMDDLDCDAVGELLIGFTEIAVDKIPTEKLQRFLNFGGISANGALSYLSYVSERGRNIRDILVEIIDAFDCVRKDSNRIISKISDIILQDDYTRSKCDVRITTSFASVLTQPDDVWDSMDVNEEVRLKLVNVIKKVTDESHEANINLVAFLSINNRMDRFQKRTQF